jgi:hypothetical protein
VLRHLVSKGVLHEPTPGTFLLSEEGAKLLDESVRVMLDLHGIGERYARIWTGLLTAVETGASVYHKVFGAPFWKDLADHPEVASSYDVVNGPVGHPICNMSFDISGGWNSVKTVVQLGGNIGGELAALLNLHPHLRGTLLDLPRVVANSPEVLRAAGVTDRVIITGQSFFDPLPGGADLYLIKGVLRVWSDPVAVRMLRRCTEVVRDGGRVVLLDDVLPDDWRRAEARSEELLTLLVGGKSARKRTLTEFKDLARQAGLDVIAAGSQESWPFIVECAAAASHQAAGSGT